MSYLNSINDPETDGLLLVLTITSISMLLDFFILMIAYLLSYSNVLKRSMILFVVLLIINVTLGNYVHQRLQLRKVFKN